MAEPKKCKICGRTEFHRVCFPPEKKREVFRELRAAHAKSHPERSDAGDMDELIRAVSAPRKAPAVGKRSRDKVASTYKPGRKKQPVVAAVPVVDDHQDKAADPGADGMGAGAGKKAKPAVDRKEYLRLKAIERRAAVKLGLTVEEFRKGNGL